MKKIVVIMWACVMLVACKKSTTNQTPIVEPVNPNAPVLVSGSFAGNMGYQVSGTASIVNDNGTKRLVLKNFSSSNGPDLKVYLATTKQAGSFISLGNLKSTGGQQTYDITGMPDFAQHKFVLIWCQQFSVLFGAAEVK